MKRFCNLVKRHTLASCLVLLGLLVVSVILGIGLGPVSIRFSDVYRVMFHRLGFLPVRQRRWRASGRARRTSSGSFVRPGFCWAR